MIGALLWKEYREQRSVWLALALLGVLTLIPPVQVFAPQGLTPQDKLHDSLMGVMLILAWMHGMVCGGILLAGERESGTLTFLDGLPQWRLRVWWGKLLAGCLLVLSQAGVLAALGGWLGLLTAVNHSPLPALALFYLAFIGLGWGALCSSQCDSVLGAIGLAIFWQAVATPVVFILSSTFLVLPIVVIFGRTVPFEFVVTLNLAILLIGPFLMATHLHRLHDDNRAFTRNRKPSTESRPWRTLGWLAWQQSRGLFVGVLAFALLGGLLVPARPLFLWPIITLLIGVLCGVTVFLDEQQSGAFRFIGEQRFPLLRFWLVKTGLHIGLSVLGALLVLLPALLVTLSNSAGSQNQGSFAARLFKSSFLEELVPPGLFLVMWLAYGFSVGQLFGILFRKPLVAAVVSFGVALLLAGVWVPSLLGGGLHFWQVLGLPLFLLIASRWLIHPWLTERFASFRVGLGLLALFAVSGLLLGLGLWYRILEVPVVAEPMPLADYLKEFPAPEQNQAPTLVRLGCTRAAQLAAEQQRQHPNEAGLFLAGERVLTHGWSDKDKFLGQQLDEVFRNDWINDLLMAAELPVGVGVDPRTLTVGSKINQHEEARSAVVLLVLRGLQLQKQGKPDAFVKLFKAGLSVCRNLQHRGPIKAWEAASRSEDVLRRGLERWLENLDGHPDLVRQALDLYQKYGEAVLTNSEEQTWAEYIIALNSLDDSSTWMPQYLRIPARESDLGLLQACWLTPWERERHLRLILAAFWGAHEQRWQAFQMGRGLEPLIPNYRLVNNPSRMNGRKRELAHHRAVELMLALRLYQAEVGKPAEELTDLVPRCLAAIPLDPFDNQPMRYRLSKGEKIGWFDVPVADAPPGGGAGVPGGPVPQAPFQKEVPAGQGILWSVGEDGFDDDGHQQGQPDQHRTQGGEDIIYLVPLPGRKGK